jgi:hypothetical protein
MRDIQGSIMTDSLSEARSIWIITEQSQFEPSRSRGSEDIGGLLRLSELAETSTQTKTAIPVETLKNEMGAFLKDLDDIFSHAEKQLEKQKTEMQLDEIVLSIEISAEGQISLLGIGGKTGGKGAISLKFKRKGGT